MYEIAEIFTILVDSPLSLTARVDALLIINSGESELWDFKMIKTNHTFRVVSFNVRVQNCKKLCLYQNGPNDNFAFFGGLECAGHSFAYVAHFLFLRTQL